MPPVYARSVVESVDCRAVALAKADVFDLATVTQRATTRQAPVHYVYILQRNVDKKRFYTGLTDNLRERLQNHNAGRVWHTAKWKPWRLKSYIALSSGNICEATLLDALGGFKSPLFCSELRAAHASGSIKLRLGERRALSLRKDRLQFHFNNKLHQIE